VQSGWGVDGQRITDSHVAHALPARQRLDSRVQRLRLPHARPPGDDDEVLWLKARGLQVQLLEAGGDAGDVLLALVQALDVLERVLEDLADGERAALQPALGKAEDALLGIVHERLDILLGVEGLSDLGLDDGPELLPTGLRFELVRRKARQVGPLALCLELAPLTDDQVL